MLPSYGMSPCAHAWLTALFLSILSMNLPLLAIVPRWTLLASCLAILGSAVGAAFGIRGYGDRAPGRVGADSRGVTVQEHLLLARDEISYGFAEPEGKAARVKLYDGTHGLRLEVRVRDTREGQDVLRALGLDVGQHVTPFFAASPWGGARGAGIASGVAGLVWLLWTQLMPGSARTPLLDDLRIIAGVLLPVLTMLTWTAVSAVPTRVTVGADGLHVRWLRKKRFIPYRSIVRVVPAFGQLRIVLSDGTSLSIRGQRRSFTPATRPEHHAMVDRLRAAIDHHLARSRVQEALAQLPAPRK